MKKSILLCLVLATMVGCNRKPKTNLKLVTGEHYAGIMPCVIGKGFQQSKYTITCYHCDTAEIRRCFDSAEAHGGGDVYFHFPPCIVGVGYNGTWVHEKHWWDFLSPFTTEECDRIMNGGDSAALKKWVALCRRADDYNSFLDKLCKHKDFSNPNDRLYLLPE